MHGVLICIMSEMPLKHSEANEGHESQAIQSLNVSSVHLYGERSNDWTWIGLKITLISAQSRQRQH